MKKILLILSFLHIFIVFTMAQPPRLSGRQWKLEELNGAAVGASKAYLEFDRGLKRFSGNAGCNRIFGSVDIGQSVMTFSGVASTRMACTDAETQKSETTFLNELKKVDGFVQKENTLDLMNGKRVVMRFVAPVKRQPEVPAEDAKLEDMKWRLQSIGGTDVSKIGRTAFLLFDKEKGSAGGNSSCNVFGGTYSTTGSALSITEVVSTMRACIEDERMDVERKFFDGLRETNRHRIEDSKLLLYRDDRLLLTLIGEAK